MNDNNEEFEPLIDISETVDELEEDIKYQCFIRAVDKLGLDYNEIDPESEQLEEAFGEELKIAAVERIFTHLHEEGLVEASGVNEDGEITYKLTDTGIKYCEENFD